MFVRARLNPNMKSSNTTQMILCAIAAVSLPAMGFADEISGDESLPSHDLVAEKLKEVVGEDNAGFGLNMWATIVNRDGIVKVVAMSGENRGEQWPGSRVISAQKANTANAFSLPGLALSTANLFTAVQPGNSLFGLQFSNPVDTEAAYAGPSELYGSALDPLVLKKVGGVNVFGGGLPLYDSSGKLVGALGVSGDTSCTDHVIAWKLRNALELDYVPSGVHPDGSDNIVFDQESPWAHPVCDEGVEAVVESLPAPREVSGASQASINAISLTPEGLVKLILEADPDTELAIESSGDLRQWEFVSSARTGPDGEASFEDQVDTLRKFYRARAN